MATTIVSSTTNTGNVLGTTNTANVFGDGIYKVTTSNVEETHASKPPAPLLVAYPNVAGNATFGLLLLLHGFMLRKEFYSQLMKHIASHGFVVVAPQFSHNLLDSNATNDIETAASITSWLADGLPKVLPAKLTADVNKLALAGHSRGGKAAFALALDKEEGASSSLPLSVLIGIDPVDGTDKGQTSPAVLSNHGAKSLSLPNSLPVVVIGSGLDGGIFGTTCKPWGLSHADFYRQSESPASYFFVKDYGHLDMLDDGLLHDWTSSIFCKSGGSREPMRRFVGGVSVAFLKAFLQKNNSDLMAIKDGKQQPIHKLEFDKDFSRLPM